MLPTAGQPDRLEVILTGRWWQGSISWTCLGMSCPGGRYVQGDMCGETGAVQLGEWTYTASNRSEIIVWNISICCFFPCTQILLFSFLTLVDFSCRLQCCLITAWPILTCRDKLCPNGILQYRSAKLDSFQLLGVLHLHFLVAWPRKMGMKQLLSPPVH